MSSIVTRFAPSPTGYLHLGHAYAALFARKHAAKGKFLLRIEDIDPCRCKPKFTEALIEDLHWLGLDWDGPVRIQSEHLADYRKTLDQLQKLRLLYPCFCTRAEIQREIAAAGYAPHAPDGALLYPGSCRTLSEAERQKRIAAGEPYALRLDNARALQLVQKPLFFEEEQEGKVLCHPELFGDVVLARKEIPASYHLSVCHDDALQGITLVTRAIDLKPVTALHRLLQEVMGWQAPRYAHHRLLTNREGQRLSKRDSAVTLRELKESGYSPQNVREMLK
jgi:glutamyl-Q tRNA(Asp) synthetase